MSTKKKLVKCLVCGAIFEEEVRICPVCGLGPENFIPYEEEKQVYHKDTEQHFLILGNGAAGVSAADAIRNRNRTCSIVIISNEGVLGYNRPMLTKSLMTAQDVSGMEIHDNDWYQEKNIMNLLDRTVSSIDTAQKEVLLTDGVRLKYDKCIYALGSECFIPPIKGHQKPQVIAIRRLADTQKIGSLIPETKEIVVIGGGVLGLEAAWELHKAGCRVTILELAPQLMGRQLDLEAGEMLEEIIRQKGIEVRLNVKIEEIVGETSVEGVRLSDGSVIPAQMVIVSAGVRANTAVAQAAGIETGRAVIVNVNMETNVPDIYACGDCAEYGGINYAIWPQAVEEGMTAGANAAGDNIKYEPVVAALTFHGMDTSLYAIGDNGKDPEKHYTVKRIRSEDGSSVKTYYYEKDRLVGAILIGDTSDMSEVTAKITG